MQFLVIAHDAKDPGAFDRRVATRAAHVATIDRYKASGNMKIGAAILDDSGKMVGSCIIVDFPSQKELDQWLAEEPYIKAKVWHTIEIHRCQIGPSFTSEN